MPDLKTGYGIATIAAAASESDAVNCLGLMLTALEVGANWTAADMYFKASSDGVTYNTMYKDDGTEYSIKAAASRFILLDPTKFAAIQYLKVESGPVASRVAQTSGATIKLHGI